MADEDEFFHTGQVAKGTILGLIGTFFVKIVSFIYSVYIAHAFAQEDIGVFFLSISIVGLFGAWRDLGLPAALARYVPYFESRHQAGKIRSLLFSAFAINIATGILMSVPVYLAADYVGELYNSAALPDALRMMAAFMLVESLSKVCTSYLQSRADIKSGQLVSNVQSVAKLLITFALFSLFGAGLSALIGGYILSFLLSVAVAIPIVIRRTRDLQGSPAGLPTRSLISEIIPFGIMLSIVQLLWTLISYTDKVLLGYLSPLGEAERVVAIYSLATTLALNVMVFPGAVGAIFLPLISRLVGKGDFTGMRRMVGAGVRWVLLITLPVSVVMAVYATEMLSGFYGGSYADGGPAMAIFVLGMIISCFSYATMLALAAMRLVSLEFKVALFAGLLNVALCFLFIPPLGMVGAALSSSLSLLASMLLFLHYGYSVLKIGRAHV